MQIEKIRQEIKNNTAIDVGGVNHAVLLVGSGRSGTTWIANLLSRGMRKRLLFEPLHPDEVSMAKVFLPRQYIRVGDQDPKWVRPVETMLRGRMRDYWTCRHNHQFISHGRLIKLIRANLMLPWMIERYPEIKTVFIMRNPVAVALSRLEMNWTPHIEVLLNQQNLMEDWLEPFRARLESGKTDFQKHVLLWAVEQYLPAKALAGKGIYLESYESFCLRPEETFQKVSHFLGNNFDSRVLDPIKQPSITTSKSSAVYHVENLITFWKNRVDDEQLLFVNDTLEAFDLARFYNLTGDYVYPDKAL